MYSQSVRANEMPRLKRASLEGIAHIWKSLGTPGKGAVIGLSAMMPFLPGMLGSRRKGGELRDIYSGNEPVPIRASRWWEVGSTAFEGARIKEWRPHWSALHKSNAEDTALYGSEAEKWKRNPIQHPIRWLRDPYYLEERSHQVQPSFRSLCNLRNPLPCLLDILYYSQAYELFEGSLRRRCKIRIPGPVRRAHKSGNCATWSGPAPELRYRNPGDIKNRAT